MTVILRPRHPLVCLPIKPRTSTLLDPMPGHHEAPRITLRARNAASMASISGDQASLDARKPLFQAKQHISVIVRGANSAPQQHACSSRMARCTDALEAEGTRRRPEKLASSHVDFFQRQKRAA